MAGRPIGSEGTPQVKQQEPIRVLVIAPALAVRLGLRALLSTDQAIEVIGEAPALSGFDSLPSGADILVIAPSSGSDLDFEFALPATASTGVLLLVEELAALCRGSPLFARSRLGIAAVGFLSRGACCRGACCF